ncbi:hypothetical protein EDC04DRAFT_2599662 [Pisolithus marmoratus]|nr:hypothetical protein EDC04DRAFT_2599662 [Pisolithus marmoratus]
MALRLRWVLFQSHLLRPFATCAEGGFSAAQYRMISLKPTLSYQGFYDQGHTIAHASESHLVGPMHTWKSGHEPFSHHPRTNPNTLLVVSLAAKKFVPWGAHTCRPMETQVHTQFDTKSLDTIYSMPFHLQESNVDVQGT